MNNLPIKDAVAMGLVSLIQGHSNKVVINDLDMMQLEEVASQIKQSNAQKAPEAYKPVLKTDMVIDLKKGFARYNVYISMGEKNDNA
jgi:hypothetical protein